MKDFLGIHSPSTLFAGIGKNMALGIGVGFGDAMTGVSRQIQDSIPTNLDGIDVSVSGARGGRLVSPISQTVNVYSPAPLAPSQIARESKNALRRLSWA